eukprot:s848_g3.t5
MARLVQLLLLAWAGLCLLWCTYFYVNLPVISIEDAEVCPSGSELGGVDTCNATRREGPCFGGTLKVPCRCAEGYQPYIHRFTLAQEAYEFRCCSQSDSDRSIEGPPCGDPALLGVLAPLFMGVGAFGFLVCVYFIHCAKPALESLRPEDQEIEAPVVRDGAHLHNSVEMRKWAVSLSDIQQFRRLVLQAVRDGRIKPTDRDAFDPADTTQGPSMYTVTEQYIKPVTEAAGKMSWALMKHPEGLALSLDCDLFITHGWSEGIFEFADKVTYCWPRGATAAYVCFLSNPQNLDIGHLIASPEESPFARALTASQQMLVVPNHQASIYTRIWCVYEAFLAYTLKKPIRTALSPVSCFWPRVLRVFFACVASHGLGFLLIAGSPPNRRAEMFAYEAAGSIVMLLSSLVMIFFFKTRRPGSRILELMIYVYGVALPAYFIPRAYGRGIKRDTSVMIYFQKGFIRGDRALHLCRSGDRPLAGKGAAGAVAAAEGVEAEVDDAISVLLDMGQSSSGLHKVTKQTGPLGDISTWSRTLFFVSLNYWITNANQLWTGRVLGNDPRHMPDWLRPVLFGTALLECVTFLIMFILIPPHRKAFAERTEILIVIFLMVASSISFQGPPYEYAYAFFLNPLILCLSFAGPAKVARVPLIGAPFVRALFGRNPFRATELQRNTTLPKEEVGKEPEVLSF